MRPNDFVDEESINNQPKPRWFIDLDWYQQNNRSLSVLVQDYLCPKCRKQLGAEKGEILVADLLPAIRDCCSKTPGFITHQLPILESVFRFFLANGNQPLDLEELLRQLSEWWDGDTYRISPESLSCLLSSDQYYGLCQISESGEPES